MVGVSSLHSYDVPKGFALGNSQKLCSLFDAYELQRLQRRWRISSITFLVIVQSRKLSCEHDGLLIVTTVRGIQGGCAGFRIFGPKLQAPPRLSYSG